MPGLDQPVSFAAPSRPHMVRDMQKLDAWPLGLAYAKVNRATGDSSHERNCATPESEDFYPRAHAAAMVSVSRRPSTRGPSGLCSTCHERIMVPATPLTSFSAWPPGAARGCSALMETQAAMTLRSPPHVTRPGARSRMRVPLARKLGHQ